MNLWLLQLAIASQAVIILTCYFSLLMLVVMYVHSGTSWGTFSKGEYILVSIIGVYISSNIDLCQL